MGVEKGNKLEGLLEAQIFKALEDLMNEDQCMYDTIMFEEVDTDDQNEQECGVNEPEVDYSDEFNTSQVFDSRDDVLQWAQSVAYENGLVAVIIRYRVPRLDFVGVTPTGMTFAAGFAYLEGEHLNNVVWALERFHINENVKAKCKSLIGQKNAWEYVMDAWGSLVDCLLEQQFDECLKKFEMACSPWPMFVDYVNETWIISHKEKFVIAWTNKDFIDNIVDVKPDGNYGYRSVAELLGMGEDSWSLVHNHLLKELGKFSYDYIKLFDGTDRFEELRMSLLVDELTKTISTNLE
ncbi:uncharacterized protein LOC114410536 [Glycine soja]|uniref:uncharacterized protein LOC114410536 n=1 Tax=Glycine soja TaxID=3848 RepID=UPI0010404BA1|nr:uncharacterized protein LOC114410536 [Glycine soja]